MMNKIRLNARLVSSLNSVLFKSAAELMDAAGIASTTWYKVMKEPNAITVQQLLAISNALKIPVRRFFSSGSSDIVGHHDDYVVDNCLPCSYDADSLRAFVESNNRVTWQMARSKSRARLPRIFEIRCFWKLVCPYLAFLPPAKLLASTRSRSLSTPMR